MTTNAIIAVENLLETETVTASTEAAGFEKENAYDNILSDFWKPTAVPATLAIDGGVRPRGMWLADIVDGTTDQTPQANTLTENGTVTIGDAGTNTGLQALSGFSAANYFSRAYDADFDYGVGDFFVMGWIKKTTSGAIETIFSRGYYSGVYLNSYFQVYAQASGKLTFYIDNTGISSSDFITSDYSIDGNGWTHFYAGRNGTVIELYLDAVKAASDVTIVGATTTLDNGSATLRIGLSQADTLPATNSSLALIRTGAIALSATKIKSLYDEEKKFFEDNAAAPTNYLASWMPTVDYFAIAAHKMGGTLATIKLQYSDDNSIWVDALTAFSVATNNPVMKIITESSHDYWRVYLDGAIVQFGVISFGKSVTMERGLGAGFAPMALGSENMPLNSESTDGVFIGRSTKKKPISAGLSFRSITPAWMRANWPSLLAELEAKPFFILPAPDTYPDEAAYCWTKGQISNPVYDGNNLLGFTIPIMARIT